VDRMGRAGLRRGLEVPGRECRQAGTAACGRALLGSGDSEYSHLSPAKSNAASLARKWQRLQEEAVSLSALQVPRDAAVDVSEAHWRNLVARVGGPHRRAQTWPLHQPAPMHVGLLQPSARARLMEFRRALVRIQSPRHRKACCNNKLHQAFFIELLCNNTSRAGSRPGYSPMLLMLARQSSPAGLCSDVGRGPAAAACPRREP
jgi:hypothetical protein